MIVWFQVRGLVGPVQHDQIRSPAAAKYEKLHLEFFVFFASGENHIASGPKWTDGDRIVIAGRDSAQVVISQIGQELTRRNLDVQPTLTNRPGLPVRLIVNRDLLVRPYQHRKSVVEGKRVSERVDHGGRPTH